MSKMAKSKFHLHVRFSRLIVFISILTIIYSVLNFITVIQATKSRILHIEETLTTTFSEAIGKSILNQMLFSDPAIFQGLISSLVTREDIVFAYIINPEGEYLVHTFAPVIPEEIVSQLHYEQGNISLKTKKYGEILVSSTPLYYGKLGHLVIGQRLPSLFDLWLKLGAMSLLLLILYIVFFRFFVSKPLEDLSKGAVIIGEGNLDHKIFSNRKDDIGDFVRVFDNMRINLKKTNDEMNGVNHELMSVNKHLEEARDEALEATKTKSLFLANMSHELRTPLNSVIGFANILLKNKQENLNSKDLKYLDRILSNGRHLLGIINDILDLSKIEAGKMELELSEVVIDQVIQETIEQLEGRVLDKNVELIIEIPSAIKSFEGDAGKFKQVLINLVGNAIKFTSKGSVTIKVEVDSESNIPTKIHVSDTGIGIPSDKLKGIFDAFQQTDSSISRKYEGTGLGLTICKSFLHLMGHEISVESIEKEGSTFSILLSAETQAFPYSLSDHLGVKKTHSPSKKEMKESSLEINGKDVKTVLIINEESSEEILVTQYLQDLGCDIVIARTKEEGVELTQGKRVDLIILVSSSKKKNLWSTLQDIKTRPEFLSSPIITTAINEKDRGVILEVKDFFDQPVTQEEILKLLPKSEFSKKIKILIVEDDEDTRCLFGTYFSDEGVVIQNAENGKEAIGHLQDGFMPDLILLDLMMPIMDGIEFFETIHNDSRYSKLPVAVVTSKELEKREYQYLNKEALAVLRKGDDLEKDLKSMVNEILNTKADEK